ncbi:MAG: class I SAM-dependent methyltransferase [Woeseiaceae bacterium]
MQADSLASFPAPDATSAEHSRRCAEHIRNRIAAAGGSISFAEYMHEALYAPGLGYYAAGAARFGEAGDFVTAPEVSPLFGNVIARQCAAVLDTVGGGILEFGAGSGRLAADVLMKLDELGALPDAYSILEISPDLTERQQQTLAREIPGLVSRVNWLTALPDGFDGVVLANEVLDALPVERFVRRKDVRQLRVTCDGVDFRIEEAPAPEVLAVEVERIESALGAPLADGYVSEVSLGLQGWISDMLACLSDGMALLFDYGVRRHEYYARDRSDGWLRCHFRHRAHSNPLILPGIQDITAWVDFSAAKDAAAGAEIAGYVTQAAFLLAGGLDRELRGMARLPAEQQIELSAQVKKLTLPGEMGEHFKCLGLSKGPLVNLDAFGANR